MYQVFDTGAYSRGQCHTMPQPKTEKILLEIFYEAEFRNKFHSIFQKQVLKSVWALKLFSKWGRCFFFTWLLSCGGWGMSWSPMKSPSMGMSCTLISDNRMKMMWISDKFTKVWKKIVHLAISWSWVWTNAHSLHLIYWYPIISCKGIVVTCYQHIIFLNLNRGLYSSPESDRG